MKIGKLRKWLRLWRGWTALELASSLEYRFDFLLRVIAMAIFGAVGPIIALLIYNVSAGLPGWSLEQFLLLTGTFTLVLGIDRLFFISMCWKIVEKIRHGDFDIDLVKPARPLSFVTATAVDLEGLPQVFVGGVVVSWALLQMDWAFSAAALGAYLLLVALGLLFKYAINVITAALAFLIVKSYTLLNIFESILDIGRNPLTIYGSVGMLLFTFFLPVGLMAFYPAAALLGQLSLFMIVKLAVIAIVFFAFSIFMWNAGIRKYQSAGG